MLLVWLGEVVCDVFLFIVGLGNEDKILGCVFFFFFGERERERENMTRQWKMKKKGRVECGVERRKGREEGTLL